MGDVTRSEGSTVDLDMADDIDHLARTSFFADAAPEHARHAVAAAGHERDLVRGDVLFNEGDPPDCPLPRDRRPDRDRDANPIDRRESVVALMEPGDLFGEHGHARRRPALGDGAGARAVRRAGRSRSSPCAQLFDEDPRLLWNVTRLLATRLRVMDEALADSVFLDVTGRTAKRLLELAERRRRVHAARSPRRSSPAWSARRRERVNKAIASFIRLGWLEQHDRHYRIIQRDRLELRAR